MRDQHRQVAATGVGRVRDPPPADHVALQRALEFMMSGRGFQLLQRLVRHRQGRIDLEHLAIIGDRFVEHALGPHGVAAVEIARGVRGIEPQRFIEIGNGVVVSPGEVVGDAAERPDSAFGVVAVGHGRNSEGPFGLPGRRQARR